MTWPESDRWEQAETGIRRWWTIAPPANRKWEAAWVPYRFGWEWARSRRYSGLSFEQCEPDLQRFWQMRKGPSDEDWAAIRAIAEAGWKRARAESWGHAWNRRTW
ncbi:MAG: hypothetical protein HY331_10675 [Chloroflexi bacterium]|nr:hypothetical protein [Chloroflexota bacterium]